jgi:hypothetical protein
MTAIKPIRIGELLTDRHLAAVVLLGLPAQVGLAFHFESVADEVRIFGVRQLTVTESTVETKIKQKSLFGVCMGIEVFEFLVSVSGDHFSWYCGYSDFLSSLLTPNAFKKIATYPTSSA